MSTYSYRPLNTEEGEIRLLSLLPATDFEDPIHLTISHVKLVALPERPRTWTSIEDLRATLPAGWRAFENLEGHYFFWNRSMRSTTYTHPDAHFDRSEYPVAEDLECLDFEPQYEALSYTWGDSQCQQTVHVKDTLDEAGPWQHLPARTNLISALRHMRQNGQPRTLWIDALSINQSDIAERSEQIRHMSNIFRLAYRVVVWLGEESDDSSLAMSTLAYLGSQVEISREEYYLPACGAREKDWYDPATPLPYDSRVWEALERLASRSWFTRLWMLQEVQLANSRATVQCGHETASLAAFRRAVLCISHNGDQSSIASRTLFDTVVSHFCYIQDGAPFAALLNAVWYKGCSDPRDNIYGILAMMSSKFVAAINVQYSTTVGDVFKDAVSTHINHVQRLETIHLCDIARQRSDAPSWVPSFSARDGSSINPTSDQFATGFSRADVTYVSPRTLRVYGVQIGEVHSVGEIGWHKQDDDVLIDFSKHPDGLFTAQYVCGGSLLDAYLSTLLFGDLRDRFRLFEGCPSIKDWAHTYTAAMRKTKKISPKRPQSNSLSGNTRDFTTEMTPRMKLPLDPYLSDACHWQIGRGLIQTDTGHIGLGPLSAQPGDLLSVLLGCDVPILLRPRVDGAFQVVGACYTHGLSDAFALLGSLPEDWKVEIESAAHGIPICRFVNTVTGEDTEEDPRLGPLPQKWEQYERPWTQDDPETFVCFRNKVTGEEITYDPRMEPDTLRARGVNVEQFDLV